MEETKFYTGLELVGQKAEYWNTNKKTGKAFKSIGIVIKYRKKKGGCNYLVEFPPTINQTKPFKMWFRRSSINQID